MNMHSTPEISVLMPAFNAEKYIGKAIESILCQSFSNFEFIIINDGSTDRTKEIIQSYNDPRIILFNQDNLGIAKALNLGLAIASADLVARFDADDIALPNRLELQYKAFAEDKLLVVVGSSVNYIDEEGNEVFEWEPPAFTDKEIKTLANTVCPFIHSSVMYKKEPILDLYGYNEHAHSFEDHLLWVQVLSKGKVFNLKQPLIKVRLNANSITIDERWRPAVFRKIKKTALSRGNITEAEGKVIKRIIDQQDKRKWKQGAYFALLGKKYLWNNYQPEKARRNFRKAIAHNPFYTTGYGLLAASFLPQNFIKAFYKSYKVIQ
jgi:glycosyltransferase involved in cell wall biosynthesis